MLDSLRERTESRARRIPLLQVQVVEPYPVLLKTSLPSRTSLDRLYPSPELGRRFNGTGIVRSENAVAREVDDTTRQLSLPVEHLAHSRAQHLQLGLLG